METRLIRVKECPAADEQAWRELGDRAVEPNPSFEADSLIPASRCMDVCSDMTVVIAEEGSVIRGVLPIRFVEHVPRPPVRIAGTFDPRWPPGQYACSPLVDPSCIDETVEALLRPFGTANKDGWPGIVQFTQLPSDGPIAAALRRVCATRGYALSAGQVWTRGLVTRDRWEPSLNPKHRRAFERYKRQLGERYGGDITVTDRTHDPDGIDDFLKVEMSGWKGREGGRAHARDLGSESFFRERHARYLAAGRAVLLSLNAGDRPVAMQYYLRSGPGLFTIRIAYDEECARQSPGSILFAEAITYLGENTDAEWLDSATQPEAEFFLRLMPERRSLFQMIVGIRTSD